MPPDDCFVLSNLEPEDIPHSTTGSLWLAKVVYIFFWTRMSNLQGSWSKKLATCFLTFSVREKKNNFKSIYFYCLILISCIKNMPTSTNLYQSRWSRGKQLVFLIEGPAFEFYPSHHLEKKIILGDPARVSLCITRPENCRFKHNFY